MAKITFKRETFSEQVAQRIISAGPKGMTRDLANAALDVMLDKYNEAKLREPKTDNFDLFNRVAAAAPNSMKVIMRAHTGGLVEPADVAADYAVEA